MSKKGRVVVYYTYKNAIARANECNGHVLFITHQGYTLMIKEQWVADSLEEFDLVVIHAKYANR